MRIDAASNSMVLGASGQPPIPTSAPRAPADLAALVGVLPSASLLLAADAPRFTILAASPPYIAATRQTRESLVASGLFEVFPEHPGEGGVDALRASLERALVTGAPDEIALQRYDVRRPDGSIEERYWRELNAPVTDANGIVRYVLHTVEDRTETVVGTAARHRAERLQREAEEANRAKTEFLAIMSHELRTPLNAIGGYAELLELGIHGPLTEAQRDAIGRLRRSQKHLLGLINQVLHHARIETHAVRYNLEAVLVSDILHLVQGLLAPQLRAKELRYSANLADTTVAMYADREKVQQIVVNLLSNAVKFTPRGGRVAIECETARDAVRIAVRDTGIGIAPDKLESIFEPFVQVESGRNRSHEGVGLGLAIARNLARGMHGDLTVESAVGSGSRFVISLPRA
jgi:signal transduction histidine kinase